MAEVAPEKSRGLKFAEQQMLRHGWEHGKGLGRNEDGISEAIKVKVKCNKGGVGHKEGEQFTFHWWDHVFNKASSSLQVESDQDGIKVRKTVEDEDDGVISNKKPRKAAQAKAKLYGSFVKSGTLLGGQEQPEPKSSDQDDDSDSSSSSSDEEDEQKLDLSSANKLSDIQLMKACGGRTAHKGARHGLTMSAKLARLEQQEAEFMAKYGNKNQTQNNAAMTVCDTPAPPAARSAEEGAEPAESKKKKKKRKKERAGVDEQNGGEVCESPEPDMKPKKKKKKQKDEAVEMSDDVIAVENGEREHGQETKRKHKKKKNKQNEEEAEEPEPSTDATVQKKKRKEKKKKSETPSEEGAESNGTESSQSESASRPTSVHKKRKVSPEEAEVQEEESTLTHKRTKSQNVEAPGRDARCSQEELPPKKKKKKKCKD